jgi:catechol 2,3-dioxygenase-like lactoylglutathione lyase family enzyme
VDMKLEVVVVPVSDVDRAKRFYKALGWREDADFATGEQFRVVQLTPPGSPGRRRVLVLGVYPVQDAAAPRRGVHEAREAAATARVDAEAALAWRDFMVSDYSDTGQQRWLASKGIDLLRGTGRLAGPGAVEVDGVRHTAEHVVVATGAYPVVPPIPGLRELEGIWTNREVTGMKAIPRRMVVLGGGPVGVEMAQAVRRLGGEVVLTTGGHLLSREPAPLGEALGEVLRRDGVELVFGVHVSAARRDGTDYVLTLDDGRELRGDRLLVATGRRPRVDGGLGRRHRGAVQRYRSGGRRTQGRHLHPRLRRIQRLPDAAQRRRAAHRRLRARPRGRRVAATGHPGHPRPRPA